MRNITPSFQTWHSGQPKFSTPFPYLREQPDGESKLLHPCMLEAAAEANIRLKGTSAESPLRGEHPTAIPVLRVGPCMGTEHTVDGASAPTIPGLSPSFKIFKIFVQKNKKKRLTTPKCSLGLTSHSLQLPANIFQWVLAENLWVLTVVLFSATS